MLEVKFTGSNLGEIQNQVREFLAAGEPPQIQVSNKTENQVLVTLTDVKSNTSDVLTPKTSTPKPSLAAVRLQFVELLKANMNLAVKLLAEFGVAKVSD